MDVPVGMAQVRLAALVRGDWLLDVSRGAYGKWNRGLARVGPLGSSPWTSRLVEVQFRDLAVRGDIAILTLRWEAAGAGSGLFPVLDADITLTPLGPGRSLLALAGCYRPPLGVLGAGLDRAVMRRVANATCKNLLTRMSSSILRLPQEQGTAQPATAIEPTEL